VSEFHLKGEDNVALIKMDSSYNFSYLLCPPQFKSKFLDIRPERELDAFKTKKDRGFGINS